MNIMSHFREIRVHWDTEILCRRVKYQDGFCKKGWTSSYHDQLLLFLYTFNSLLNDSTTFYIENIVTFLEMLCSFASYIITFSQNVMTLFIFISEHCDFALKTLYFYYLNSGLKTVTGSRTNV